MKKIVRTTLAASIAMTLAACGGSDSKDEVVVEPPTPTTLEITGQAIKGTLSGALVEVFNASDLTTPIGSAAQTDETGSYTVTITDETGEPIVGAYVVRVTADDDTTMICDAAVCGDVVRGGTIAAEDLAGLTLSSFTYSDGTGNIAANVNALTTMATDVLLAAVSANENIDLATVTKEGVTNLQLGASEVVGNLLGTDLSATNIYDVNIIDATTYTADTNQDITTNTLTFINAAFSGLETDVVAGEKSGFYAHKDSALGLGEAIAKYLSTFKEIVEILVLPGADLSTITPAQLAVITGTQTQFNALVADIRTQVVADTGTDIDLITILTEVSLQEIIDIITTIEPGTGGS